jgi:hypothetical protein
MRASLATLVSAADYVLAPEPRRIAYACALSRRALPMTDTEDKLMASAAISGLSSKPNTG